MAKTYKVQLWMYCNPIKSKSGRKWCNDEKMTTEEAEKYFSSRIKMYPDLYFGYRLRDIETKEIVYEYIV